MANKIFNPVNTTGKARINLVGSFQPNGAATTITGLKGRGFSVSHAAGANTYTVVVDDSYFDYDAAWTQLQSATLGIEAQIVAEPVVSGQTRSIVIGLFDSGTKAAVNDQAFNANTRVHFGIMLKNTSLGANY